MADPALLNRKLGRYDILRVLGKGAMGVVYEARDPNLNRRVAIKVIGVDTLSPEEAADYEQRFRTEAHSAARLQHPNIVSVYDSDRDGDTPYLVMEYVDGKDLKRHLDSGQRYTLEQSVRMVCDLLSALEYAHHNNVVHRDIKPANMLIEASGRLKLTDFGVARIQDLGDGTRTQGGMVGTLKYMSPEQVDGKPVDASSDMFSAGIVLYQLLTDRRPFDGDSYFAIATQITSQPAAPPSSINPMLPPELDAVVEKALAKEKGQRYASAIDFALALQAAARSADPTIVPSANPYKNKRSGATLDERSGSTVNLRAGRGGGSLSTITQELELVYWKDVKDSDDLLDLEGFLRRFPDGVYSDLAKRRLKRIAGLTTQPGTMPYEQTEVVSRTGADPGQDTHPGNDGPTVVAPAAPASNAPADASGSQQAANASAHQPNLPADPDATYVPPARTAAAAAASPDALAETFPGVSPAPSTGPIPAPTPVSKPPETPAGKAPSNGNGDRSTRSPAKAAAQTADVKKAGKGGLWLGLAAAVIIVGATWFWFGSDHKPAVVAGPTETPVAAAPAASAASSEIASSAPTASGTPGIVSASSAPASMASAAITQASAASGSVPAVAATALAASSPASAARFSQKPGATASAPRAGRDANQRPLPAISAPRIPAAEPEPPPRPASAPASPPPARVASPAAERPAQDNTHVDPREVCKGKFMFAYGTCMSDQCALPGLQNHAACVELREQNDRRRNIEQSR